MPRGEWEHRRVREAMTPVGETLVMEPGRPLADGLSDLAGSPVGRALVCSGDRLDGLLSITDVARVVELRSAEPDGARASGAGMAAEPVLGKLGR